ncbi:Hypothetical protein NTJ_01387 [Nesidiocoris tenuis]|uniref:Uncharacterized protein n=1 Tax=Nesidiocoris tenuis TaxID=355587 RepID=A0ABN7A8F6_9HEMI|nr:Hypothetical protein NTJ_01387 [Nesidiocoris tenuis]
MNDPHEPLDGGEDEGHVAVPTPSTLEVPGVAAPDETGTLNLRRDLIPGTETMGKSDETPAPSITVDGTIRSRISHKMDTK